MRLKTLLGLVLLASLVLLPVGVGAADEKPAELGKPFQFVEKPLPFALAGECSISSIDCENRVIYVNDVEACEEHYDSLVERAEAACAPIAN